MSCIGTHSGVVNPLINSNHEDRLLSGDGMVMIWHERLIHSEAKTQASAGGEGGNFKDAIRIFSHIWQQIQVGVPKSCARIKVNEGNTIHRLKKYLCENRDNGKWGKCNEGAIVLKLNTNSRYQVCEKF